MDMNGLFERLAQEILPAFRIINPFVNDENDIVSDQGFGCRKKAKITFDDMAFGFAECLGVFPLLDIALHRNLRRHPMIGATVEIKMPGPFIFKRHQLIHIDDTVIINDLLFIGSDSFPGHSDCFGHDTILPLKYEIPIFLFYWQASQSSEVWVVTAASPGKAVSLTSRLRWPTTFPYLLTSRV